MVVPGHENVLNNLDSLHTSMQVVQDHIHMNLDFHSSVLLSDAADAVADAATDAAEDGDWWKSYLNVFKSGLVAVHSGVDGPLQSLGVTETWGPSIALFTVGKTMNLCFNFHAEI